MKAKVKSTKRKLQASAFATSITERKLDKLHLATSEQKYRKLIETMHEAVLFLGMNDELFFANKRFYELTGYSFSELSGKQAFEKLLTKEGKKVVKEKRELRKKGISDHYEVQLIKKNGELIWILVNASPITNSGITTGILATLTDITKRRKTDLIKDVAYNIASKTNRRIIDIGSFSKDIHHELRKIADIKSFYIAIFNNEENLISFPYFSDKHGKVKNKKSRKFGTGFTEYVIKTRQPLFVDKNQLLKLSRQKKIRIFDTEIPELYIGIPLKFEGRVVGNLAVQSFGSANDYSYEDYEFLKFVSGQISTTIAKLQMEDELFLQEKYYRTLVENSSDITAIYDKNGKFTYLSPSVEKILGYKPIELLGKSFTELAHPDETDKAKDIISKRLKVVGLGNYMTWALKKKDGTFGHFDVISNNLFGNPTINGMVLNGKDVSEKKRYEHLLKEISEDISTNTGINFFEQLVQGLSKSLEVDFAFVGTVNRDGASVNILSYFGKHINEMSRVYMMRNSPAEKIIGRQLYAFPKDVQKIFPKDIFLKKLKVRSYIGVPLFDSKYIPAGILVVMDTKPMQELDLKKSVLNVFASRASAELERLQTIKRLEIFHKIDKAILEAKSKQEIADAALNHIKDLTLFADRVSIAIFDFEKSTARFLAAKHSSKSKITTATEIPLSSYRNIKQLQKGKHYLLDDLKRSSFLSESDKILLKEGIRSYIIYPLIVNKKLIGTFNIGSKVPSFYDFQNIELIEEVANQLALAINNSNLIQALEFSDHILNKVNSIVIAATKDGNITYVSPSVEQILGFKREELLGQKWWRASTTSASHAQLLKEEFMQYFKKI